MPHQKKRYAFIFLYIKRDTSDHGPFDEHEKNKSQHAAAFFSLEKKYFQSMRG
jgi:hypothetical protein